MTLALGFSSCGGGIYRTDFSLDASPLEVELNTSFEITASDGPFIERQALVTNSSPVLAYSIESISFSGENEGQFAINSDNDCLDRALDPKATCSFVIRAIASENGESSAYLVFNENRENALQIPLSIIASDFELGFNLSAGSNSPLNVTDGNVAGVSETFTLTNTGTRSSSQLLPPTIAGDDDAFTVTNDTCTNEVLQPQGSCTFVLQVDVNSDRRYAAAIAIGDQDLTSVPLTVSGRSLGFNEFITVWNTAELGGVSAANQITLPLEASGSYDFRVDWGDGTFSDISTFNSPDITHTYAVPGTYTVTISGLLDGFRFNNTGDKTKLIDIVAWGGAVKLGNSGSYFYGCENLTGSATDSPDLSETTDLSYAFAMPTTTNLFNMNLANWNVSAVTNFDGMFRLTVNFNADISGWNTASATNFRDMFRSNVSFNQDISGWNTSNVTTMERMFHTAHSFNQNIDSWDVSRVELFTSMFFSALDFNQSLNSWQLDSAEVLAFMFQNATSFNGDITLWDTSNVSDFYGMFRGNTSFNQDIGGWNLANATNLSEMFKDNAGVFDQNISSWNLENVTELDRMFENSGLSQANYDALLIGWSAQNVQPNVDLDAGSSQYSTGAATTARSNLTGTDNWSILDGGQN